MAVMLFLKRGNTADFHCHFSMLVCTVLCQCLFILCTGNKQNLCLYMGLLPLVARQQYSNRNKMCKKTYWIMYICMVQAPKGINNVQKTQFSSSPCTEDSLHFVSEINFCLTILVYSGQQNNYRILTFFHFECFLLVCRIC